MTAAAGANPDFFERWDAFTEVIPEPDWTPESAHSFLENMFMLMALDEIPEPVLHHAQKKILAGELPL